MNIDSLNQTDSKKMFQIYDKWPEIARDTYGSSLETIEFKDINHIVFSGMGGSGAIADIFYSILSQTPIHVDIVKGYNLPNTVNSRSLVVSTSVSGDTQETFHILKKAKETSAQLIGFSNGGKLEKFCVDNKIEFRHLEKYHSPRASLVSFLYSMIKILMPILPLNEKDVTNSISSLEKLNNEISSKNLSESNPSLNLAEWIDKIPIIYYPWGLQAVAIRFKNSLSENAKTFAATENVIEACHNQIECWEKSSNAKPILIQGLDDNPFTKERWKILKQFFETKKIDYREILSVQGSILSKLITLIYHLDYTSIYLAVLNHTDPTPINAIDYLKSKID